MKKLAIISTLLGIIINREKKIFLYLELKGLIEDYLWKEQKD
jgi:hypothetical protein